MLGVGRECRAVEILGEELFGRAAGLILIHRVEAEASPSGFAAFDDEGRGVGFELISVRPDPAVFCLLERKGERFERFVGAEPDVFVRAQIDVDAEVIGVECAPLGIRAVAGKDEIVLREQRFIGFDFGAERELYAEFARAILQDVEQTLPSDADKAVAGRGDGLAVYVDVNVVPMGEARFDLVGALGIVGAEVFHRLIGEDDAPAERVAGIVALEHDDLVPRVAQLHRDRED